MAEASTKSLAERIAEKYDLGVKVHEGMLRASPHEFVPTPRAIAALREYGAEAAAEERRRVREMIGARMEHLRMVAESKDAEGNDLLQHTIQNATGELRELAAAIEARGQRNGG